TNEAQCAPADGNETRRFAEDEPTQEDRDGWNEVRGRGETPGLAARERIGPRREGDRGREDAEEEEPANSAEWHGLELVHDDRRDEDEHRGGARVDPPLGIVEDDVVDAEPEQAGEE